jgi:hypothetical protein
MEQTRKGASPEDAGSSKLPLTDDNPRGLPPRQTPIVAGQTYDLRFYERTVKVAFHGLKTSIHAPPW